MKYGGTCNWCHGKVTFGTPGVRIYEKDGIILCPPCAGTSELDQHPVTRIYVPGPIIDAMS